MKKTNVLLMACLTTLMVSVSAYGDACCLDDGSCMNLGNENFCNLFGGTWIGGGVSCAAADCDGACCLKSGLCTDGSRSDCLVSGGTFRGHGSKCSSVECTGACCLLSGGCLEGSQNTCALLNGSFQGFEVECDDVFCGDGACCVNDQCFEWTVLECALQDGLHLGPGSGCSNIECEAGPFQIDPNPGTDTTDIDQFSTQGDTRILNKVVIKAWLEMNAELELINLSPSLSTDTTTVEYQGLVEVEVPVIDDMTINVNGTFDCGGVILGPGDGCVLGPASFEGDEMDMASAPPSNLAPFIGNGTFDATVQASGTFYYQGGVPFRLSVREHNTDGKVQVAYEYTAIPDKTGACCMPDGSCEDGKEFEECFLSGGILIDGEECDDIRCPGACCLPDGSCEMQVDSDCLSNGGLFFLGMSCSPSPCAQDPGACCLPNNTCTEITEGLCDLVGGVYQGDATECSTPLICFDPTGACCFSDGSCIRDFEISCEALGGTFQGDLTTCGSVNCPQPTGACCMGDGFCPMVAEADCEFAGGTYLGNGTSCDPCVKPSAACCLDDGSCVFLPFLRCIQVNGSWLEGQSCATTQCGPCAGDVDGSGTVDINDLLAVVLEWGVCPPLDCDGDLDHSGVVDVNDVLIVLLDWGPCP